MHNVVQQMHVGIWTGLREQQQKIKKRSQYHEVKPIL